VCTQPALLLWPPCPRQSGLAALPAEFAADAVAVCPAKNADTLVSKQHLCQDGCKEPVMRSAIMKQSADLRQNLLLRDALAKSIRQQWKKCKKRF
jgi:hypothetical protein